MVDPYESPPPELPKPGMNVFEREAFYDYVVRQAGYWLGLVGMCVASYWCCEYYKTDSVWMLGITRQTRPQIFVLWAGLGVLFISLIGLQASVLAWIFCPNVPLRATSVVTGIFHLLPWLMLFSPPFARFIMQLVGFDPGPR